MSDTITIILSLLVGGAAGFIFAARTVHCENCDCGDE